MTKTNRIALNAVNVRFYMERRDAIGAANVLTKLKDLQHYAKYASGYGWCIKGVDGTWYDADGKLPISLELECKRKAKSTPQGLELTSTERKYLLEVANGKSTAPGRTVGTYNKLTTKGLITGNSTTGRSLTDLGKEIVADLNSTEA